METARRCGRGFIAKARKCENAKEKEEEKPRRSDALSSVVSLVSWWFDSPDHAEKSGADLNRERPVLFAFRLSALPPARAVFGFSPFRAFRDPRFASFFPAPGIEQKKWNAIQNKAEARSLSFRQLAEFTSSAAGDALRETAAERW
jgi:hypothetical protein